MDALQAVAFYIAVLCVLAVALSALLACTAVIVYIRERRTGRIRPHGQRPESPPPGRLDPDVVDIDVARMLRAERTRHGGSTA